MSTLFTCYGVNQLFGIQNIRKGSFWKDKGLTSYLWDRILIQEYLLPGSKSCREKDSHTKHASMIIVTFWETPHAVSHENLSCGTPKGWERGRPRNTRHWKTLKKIPAMGCTWTTPALKAQKEDQVGMLPVAFRHSGPGPKADEWTGSK